MCGITGFIGQSTFLTKHRDTLRAMTDSLTHRGPDGGDIWLDNDAGLGHRRLAIIDLNTGQQPMWDSAKEQVIVFNGEIYNYPELRRELESRGHVFQTSSDTEMIPATIREWGINEGLLRLRGMFAFALYDKTKKHMLLARDRTGIKPLYWIKKNNTVYFASETKAFLQTRLSKMSIDPASIHDYLQLGYSIAPKTMWEDIFSIPPGSWMAIGPEDTQCGTYWKWTVNHNQDFTEEEYLSQLEATLTDALKCHLLSDVPLGAFLSGGIDSSLTVALIARNHVADLNTFNVSFDEDDYNEAPYAREVASRYRTNHHEISVSLKTADPEVLIQCIEQFDEPFGDVASLPNYLLSQATARHVKVALSGDGGDEILGGYPYYFRMKWLSQLNKLDWLSPIMNPTAKFVSRFPLAVLRKFGTAWKHSQGDPSEQFIKAVGLLPEDEILSSYQPSFRSHALSRGPTSNRIEHYIDKNIRNPVDQAFTFEMRMRLNNGYLRKVDITSAAHGLETRVPFLDNKMLELAEIIPSNLKIKGNQPKYLARLLAKKYLPPRILNRAKHGFVFPFDHWSRSPVVQSFLQDTLFTSGARWKEILQESHLLHQWEIFKNPSRKPSHTRYQAYARIYSVLALELWLRKWNISI